MIQYLFRFVVLLSLSSASLFGGESYKGVWIGGSQQGEVWDFLQLQIAETPYGVAGVLSFREFPTLISMQPQSVANLRLDQAAVHFEVRMKAGNVAFDGQRTNDSLIGSFSNGSNHYDCRLDLIAPIETARYEGLYEFEPGHFKILKSANGLGALVSVDYNSGETRLLIPTAEGTFICGPSTTHLHPVEANVRITTNSSGSPSAIEWKYKTGKTLDGKPSKLREEDVSFTNGSVVLAGTLLLPPGQGRHPAAVFVHGAGAYRKDLRFIAEFYALNGVAALVYDKRGVGLSKGDIHSAGFQDLAGDALAGIEALRRRPDVDPARTGLWGMDEGGWVASLAASSSTNVAFLIAASAPGITPDQFCKYSLEHRLRTGGYSDAEVQTAVAIYDLNSLCARTGTNWEKLNTALETAKTQPWYRGDVAPRKPEDQERWRKVWDYDPAPALRKITCPVLALYGSLDRVMSAQTSQDVWINAFKASGNKGVTVLMFSSADHSLNDANLGVPAPEYYTRQRDWLKERINSKP